jgi:hypothetical protein
MGDAQSPYYEAYIKTDEWTLLGMYLIRIESLGRIYRELSFSWYNRSFDHRALLRFFSSADEYFHFAEENIKKHLQPEDYEALQAFFKGNEGVPPAVQIETARTIYQLFQRFGWKSGLLKLSATRPLGRFGKVYSDLGLERSGTPEAVE